MENIPKRVIVLLEKCSAHDLTLVEWGIPLFNRLGYPVCDDGVCQRLCITVIISC